MKYIKILVLLLIGPFYSSLNAQTSTSVQLLLDEGQAFDEFSQLLEKEIETLVGQKQAITFERKILGKDIQVGSQTPLAGLTKESDMLISLGPISSQLLSNLDSYSIPCIAGVSLENSNQATSGINNYNFIQSPFAIERDIKALYNLYPFKKLGVFVNPSLEAVIVPYFESVKSNLDIDIAIDFISTSAIPTNDLQNITDDIDAVYFLPDLYASSEKEQELIDGINLKKLPSFSMMGRVDVERGILASITPSEFLGTYARRIALNVMKILEGQNAKDQATKVSGIEDDFVINVATMEQLGIFPPFEVLSQASLVNINPQEGIEYTLASAIATALNGNISFQAASKNVAIQQTEIDIAKSNLLPSLTANLSVQTVDNNTATVFKTVGFTNPRTALAGNIELSQLIYSQAAWANVSIQKALLQAEEAGLLKEKLDLVLDISTAYLRCLQAQANLEVQNNNVQSILYNLNIAKTKANVGTVSNADVYGFESQLALNKIGLNDAQTGLEQAQIAFNQLLNRPLDESFILEDIRDIEDLSFLNDKRIKEQLNSQYDFRKLANFLIDYVSKNAPELDQLEWGIKARQHSLDANKKSRWQPQVALQGNLDQTLGRYGTRAPDEVIEMNFGIDPYAPTWNIGVNASLPIFQGNLRKNRIQQDKIALDQLALNQDLLEQGLATNIRISLENLGNSFNDVKYTQQAEKSSDEYLKLVQNLYREGAVTIVTLIDAQNNALSAKLGAVSSQYQYLIDAIIIERFLNNSYLLSSDEDKEKFINDYFNFIIKKENND